MMRLATSQPGALTLVASPDEAEPESAPRTAALAGKPK